MLRSSRLSPTCLACSTPLAGVLAAPARLMGIQRSLENPNLCSRCGHHLSIGEIHPICLLEFGIVSNLRFGSVELEKLSERELPTLCGQLRSRLEEFGALVLPVANNRPLLLSAYFNAPVRLAKPESVAYNSLLKCVAWLNTEISSLGIACDWSAALASGYVELMNCEGPLQCVPIGEVNFQGIKLFNQALPGQLLADRQFLDHLVEQDPAKVPPTILEDLKQPDYDDKEYFVLLDANGTDPSSHQRHRMISGLSSQPSRWTQLGALLLAAIAAPCAAMVVLAPTAAYLGLGAVVAALMPMWKAVGMSLWPRILITLTATIAAIINLIRVELLEQKFRQLQEHAGRQVQMPRLQRRRMRLIRWTSISVLLLVGLEGILRVTVMKMPLL